MNLLHLPILPLVISFQSWIWRNVYTLSWQWRKPPWCQPKPVFVMSFTLTVFAFSLVPHPIASIQQSCLQLNALSCNTVHYLQIRNIAMSYTTVPLCGQLNTTRGCVCSVSMFVRIFENTRLHTVKTMAWQGWNYKPRAKAPLPSLKPRNQLKKSCSHRR